ncbi:MAG: hypothetical protein AMJ92_08945 [candidate division Zixibacteria bacterium SM23_81]|nr:MAG: hypothetical protein AMJ92_08945 [candidate division Zixibacteria bacterium SM23_81]
MRRLRLAAALVLLTCAVIWSGCGNPALTGAKVYIQQQEWGKAQEQLELAVQEMPQDAESHYLLGWVYGEQGMYEPMVREFETSLEISDRWKGKIEAVRKEKWTMAFNRGVQAGKEEDFQKAVMEFKTATIIEPGEPDAFNNLAFAYTNLDSLDQALKAYKNVLELQPSNVPPMINSGVIYFNRGEYQKAQDLFHKSLELEPSNKNAISMSALTLERMAIRQRATLQTESTQEDSLRIENEVQSLLNQAVATYDQGIKAHPDDQDFAYNLGVLYAQEFKNYQAAAPLFRKVTELDPTDVDAWYNLATAQLALDDIESAQPSLEKVLELEPENGTAWYQLGVIYIKRGMRAEGEEAFKKAEQFQSAEE